MKGLKLTPATLAGLLSAALSMPALAGHGSMFDYYGHLSAGAYHGDENTGKTQPQAETQTAAPSLSSAEPIIVPMEPAKPVKIDVDAMIENPNDLDNPGDEFKNLRANSIKQAAFTIGVQTGTNERYTEINKRLDSMAVTLDQLYNFTPLMISDELIPPVIHEANDTMRFVTDSEAVSTITTYKIANKARIGVAPNWRDYLYHQWPEPKKMAPEMKPKDRTEQALFNTEYLKGYNQGRTQADQLFEDSMASLTADYTGMSRYHLLVESGVVSKPVLAKGEREVVVNGQTMSVGSVLYRITTETKYQSVEKWTPKISTSMNH